MKLDGHWRCWCAKVLTVGRVVQRSTTSKGALLYSGTSKKKINHHMLYITFQLSSFARSFSSLIRHWFFYYIYISNQTKPACRTPSSIPISSICLRQTSYDYNIEGIDQLETKYFLATWFCSRVQKIVWL